MALFKATPYMLRRGFEKGFNRAMKGKSAASLWDETSTTTLEERASQTKGWEAGMAAKAVADAVRNKE